ncbi:MAG: hypothetical protein F6J87_12190 [Spirulina sp. SIO3F2]|nr:hypothetical protein [Spirulina sp. SIO3F2]
MSLFGDSQALPQEHKRADGATIRNDYTKTIKDKGGDRYAQRLATEALTRETMGHGTKELYEKTGAKPGRRASLPNEAQKALMAAETVANHDLKATEVKGSQSQRNQQIESAAEKSGKKVRKLFPW